MEINRQHITKTARDFCKDCDIELETYNAKGDRVVKMSPGYVTNKNVSWISYELPASIYQYCGLGVPV